MESKVNYTIVGFFVMVLLIGIIVVSLWLTENLQQKPYKTYLVYMNESVAGLSQRSPVKYNGVTVGFVDNIQLNLANPQQVILYLKIQLQIPITVDTEAVLVEQGVTGIAYIELRGGKPGSKRLIAKPGKAYPVIKSVPSLLFRLDQALQDLSKNINMISNNMNTLLSKKNLARVQNILKNVNTVTENFAGNSKQIDQSIKSLNILLLNGEKASEQLPSLMTHLQHTLESINKRSNDIHAASIQLNGALEKGTLAINALADQLMPNTYSTLQNFNGAAINIKGLASELQQNPSMIIRGKVPTRLGPGEN